MLERAKQVEALARYLYDRDTEEYIRIGWDEDNQGMRESYLKEADEVLGAYLGIECDRLEREAKANA